jgi:hypothetical protein
MGTAPHTIVIPSGAEETLSASPFGAFRTDSESADASAALREMPRLRSE